MKLETIKKQVALLDSMLSEEDRAELSRYYEPKAVAVPPMDSRTAMCVMPSGEIRVYGYRDKQSFEDNSHGVYLSSADCGLSWKRHVLTGKHACSGTRLSTGEYVSVVSADNGNTGLRLSEFGVEKGLYAVISSSPDDTDFELIKICDEGIFDMYLPIEMNCGRVACAGQMRIDGENHPVYIWSNDIHAEWHWKALENLPYYEGEYPDRGYRWQNYAAEPMLIELKDGRLWMPVRTSRDEFWELFSDDLGETWTKPAPSRLHGTLTSPTLARLSDGRLLCLYNNTHPLPEMDHYTEQPELRDGEKDGTGGEDVFTNRDANHAAVSEDEGETWIGIREMALNTIRNRADFRSACVEEFDSRDKSIHQFQVIELPMHKLLVSYGQNEIARKLIIFDVDWLYETERRENFFKGIDAVSTQVYLKSVSGNNRRGKSGHCSWNRTNGAVLMPDPEDTFSEALFLSRTEDPRLYSDTQGVVWNFPTAQKGSVSIRLMIRGKGVHITLLDRWFNPIDESTPYFGELSFLAEKGMLKEEGYTDILIRWDCKTGKAEVTADGKKLFEMELKGKAPLGISYLSIQSIYEGVDREGAYIKELAMQADK